MRPAGSPDVFIVINGPQDGTEFPIGSSAIEIGQANHCTVNLQLDQSVQPLHAIATAVGKGYSIRANSTVPAYVEGKKVTRLKSRVIRPGEILRVGYTDLLLECSPDGMSGRSQGIALQNDFTWAVKNIVRSFARVLQALGRVVLTLPKYALQHWIITLVVLFFASRYVPGVDAIVSKILAEVKSFVAGVLRK